MKNTSDIGKSKIAKQAVIFQTNNIDEKIYIREQQGYFQKIRRILSWGLMFIFIFLPFITYKGQQAILFDVAQQQFKFFSVIIFPQDFLILCLLFILSAFLLFYLTSLYGRIWCGYTCPQTIWLLMFNWIERRIEGTHRHSKSLDQAPFSIQKLIKKSSKHTLWLLLSLFTALTFMSYFIPIKTLYSSFFTMESSLLVQGWVYFFTLCTYLNAGWVKDKMCLHMCPYARFQSVMFNKSTKFITYDYSRGETRGPRKINQDKPEDKGDCIDCNLCVEVCPVGIDIRDGLQYECINCGLCADACDSVMDKFNYPKGLIKYQWQVKSKNKWSQHIGYSVACFLTILAIIGWGLTRDTFEVSIIRDRQALYRINHQGNVENTYRVKILNKTSEHQTYLLSINANDNFRLRGNKKFIVNAGEHISNTVTIVSNSKPKAKKTDITFKVVANNLKESKSKLSTFFSGDDVW